MKNMQINLKEHFQEICGPLISTVQHITFERTNDFFPHNEISLGELPAFYSFDPGFKTYQGSVELKDGFATLLPFLMKNETSRSHLVLGKGMKSFLKEFNYSCIRYREIEKKSDLGYIMLDYYEALSGKQNVFERLQKIKELAPQYEQVKLVLNVIGVPILQDYNGQHLYQGIKELPGNCQFISLNELLQIGDFKGRDMWLLTDTDFVMKSPWENIFVSRGAHVESNPIDLEDQVIQVCSLGPNAEKLVMRHVNGTSRPDEQVNDFQQTLAMLKGPLDVLNVNYLRRMREFIR